MFKKLAFFLFACAAGSSYAVSSSETLAQTECRQQCLYDRFECVDQEPKPSNCFSEYSRCIDRCRAIGQ
ncbi:hypothetical protein MJ904_11470 [Massilia sp. MB5]|uniref:hypothetical protein n=1 Tax=unclassified Massilia TaxID=2609279 RepID=UPI00067B1EF7|nr:MULTISPECIES: hypothetical protein [unclassified Massilia]AKU22493.1 hypothetical protein ACZ75_14455 [Massilia sp. NR 4-1]UMR32721.1 hypothetical protein MJ904_11470 [Massilia sp. MB5]